MSQTTNKKIIWRTIILTVCMVMLVSGVVTPASALADKPTVLYAGATYEDIKDAGTEAMRQQLAELDRIQKEKKEELESALASQATYEQTRELYLTMEALYADQLNTMQIELLTYEAQIEELGKKLVATQLEYDETYEKFMTLMRMTYEDGSANYLDLILGATSLSDLFSRIENMKGLLGYNDRLMKKLESAKQELEDNRAILEQKTKDQQQAIAAIEVKKQEIADWTVENEAALAAIAAEIEAKRAEYKVEVDKYDVLKDQFDKEVNRQIAAENERRKTEEEKKRQEELAAAAKKQKYMWPLPTRYNRLSSRFNDVRTINSLGYVNKVHYGIDVPADSGTGIYAAKSGKVITATYHYSYGNYVVIDHADGTQTLYAHCSKLLVSAGTYVEKGKVIAKVGSTGKSTGPHLHFEVRTGGKAVNPLKYVNIP